MRAQLSRFSPILAMTTAIVTAVGHLGAGETEARRHFLEGWYQETAEREPEKAIAAYRKVLEARGPDRLSAKARLRIGLCLRAAGKDREAEIVFRELIDTHPGESDLTTRARRYLVGKEDPAVAGLLRSDPRVEVLSLVEDMVQARNPDVDLARFLGVLRLAGPEYVRDVVLAKHPTFGAQAVAALRPRRTRTGLEPRYAEGQLPDADVFQLLTFVGIPELRKPIFLYIVEKRDTAVVPDLMKLLDSTDLDLRFHAACALGMLGIKEAEPRIIEIFTAQTEPERVTDLARALAVLKSKAAPPLIVERILSEEIELEAGIKLISGMAIPEAATALRPLLLSETNARLEAWQHLAFPAESPLIADVIAVGLASGDPRHVFCALRKAVLSVGNPSVQEKIIPKLTDVVLARLKAPESSSLAEFLKQPFYKEYLDFRVPLGQYDYTPWLARLVDELSTAVRNSPEQARLVAPLFRRLLSTPLEPCSLRFFIDQWQELPDLLAILRAERKEERSGAVLSMVAHGTPALLIRVGTDTSMPFEARAPIIRTFSHSRTRTRDNIEILPVVTAALTDPNPAIVFAALETVSVFFDRERQPQSKRTPRSRSWSRTHHAAAGKLRSAVQRILAAAGEQQYPPAIRSVAFDILAAMNDGSYLMAALHDPLPRLRLKAVEHLHNYDPAYVRAAELGDLRVQRQFVAALIAEGNSEKRTKRNIFAERITYGVPPDPSVWVSRIEALLKSKHEEIRQSLLRLLHEKREWVGPALAMPLLRRGVKDPSQHIRKTAADLLAQYEQWEALLSMWDELAKSNPGLALQTANNLDRLDLVRTFLKHPQEQVRGWAHGILFERAKPEEVPSFLTNPHAEIRRYAAERLAREGEFHELARALGDTNTDIAAYAYETLAGFSTELKNAFSPRGVTTPQGFARLPVEKRTEIAEELRILLQKRGVQIQIGRGKELLATADELRRHPGFKEAKEAADLQKKVRELEAAAVRCLVTALPDPRAVEVLVADPRIEPDAAARALVKSDMKEAFLKLWNLRGKNGEVSEAFLNGLVTFSAISELRQLAGEPLAGGAVHPSLLVALARSGEARLAARHVENQYGRYGQRPEARFRQRWIRKMIAASAEHGTDGPLPFLELLSMRPELRDKETIDNLVAAVKKTRSAPNLLVILDKLPNPPAQEVFAALIAIGQPESVLEQALNGPFWLEAASALHEATGRWYGYFGHDYESPAAPKPAGLFLITRTDRRASLERPRPVTFNNRRHAVEAWREALNQLHSEPKRN